MKGLIVLIGMMGSGKSVVGALLSKKIGYRFIDVDKEIEKSENSTITKIFNGFGENYFRKIEKAKNLDFAFCKNTVLSLGGGAFEDKDVQSVLKKNGFVIYLKADAQCLFDRIKSEIHRPLLHKNFSVETIAFILKKRIPNYEKAHHIIDTCSKTPEEVVEKIIGVIK